MLPLESVPNFSEGRDRATIDAIGDALGAHARLLDVHADEDHNRSVFTLVGTADELSDALVAGRGSRPSASICAHTPARIRGSERRTSCRSSRSALTIWFARGRRRARSANGWRPSSACRCSSTHRPSAARPSIGAAGPTSCSAGWIRASSASDFGPSRLHECAGGIIIGARTPLIAFNVNLRGPLEGARAIAAIVREKGGGFPGLRALGLDLPSAGLVQVSMNVEDWQASPLHDIVERIAAEAEARGAAVFGSELVGLMPAGAAAAAAGAMLRIDGFDASRVLELRLLD